MQDKRQGASQMSGATRTERERIMVSTEEYKREYSGLFNRIDRVVQHALFTYGPDGHTDGHEIITGKIIECLVTMGADVVRLDEFAEMIEDGDMMRLTRDVEKAEALAKWRRDQATTPVS